MIAAPMLLQGLTPCMFSSDSEYRAHVVQQRHKQRQDARREAAAAAKGQLQAIQAHSSKRVCSDDKYGDVALPPGVLHKVMACLAVVEPDGIRGPAMAARDLASAALVSSSSTYDMHGRNWRCSCDMLCCSASRVCLLGHCDTLRCCKPVTLMVDSALLFDAAGSAPLHSFFCLPA
jgi:hypothetical protein